MRQSQLPDRGELLELARLEQWFECSLEGNCAMHGVVHHLGHGPRESGQVITARPPAILSRSMPSRGMGEEELALNGEQVDLAQFVNDEGGIWSLRQVEKVRGWNSIEYGAGLSGKNTPSTALSMNCAYIPPGGVAKAHIHVDFDVMIYLLKGSVRHEFGPGCRESVIHSAGDMFYIEPGLPHEV
ncbi:MAG TPA: cupin domain-containing protein, partial [Candidatus Poseidoniales archaeon]|nr:cupin domain-containing protein [Candidatus Poseidoniales archaeon]